MLCCVQRSQGLLLSLSAFIALRLQIPGVSCMLAGLPLLSNAVARLRNACSHRVEKGLLSHSAAVGASAHLTPTAPRHSARFHRATAANAGGLGMLVGHRPHGSG
jgi:hypothetical protein